jgi:sialate O-acetylesterase
VTGSQTVTINDLYFGEVWFCSGQSNMQMQLPFVLNGDAEVKNCANSLIRFFTTPYGSGATPQAVFGYAGNWYPVSPDTAGNLSGVGYFFARKLQKRLDTPIGIICSAVGGSLIESWISNDAFQKFRAAYGSSSYSPWSVNVYYNGMVAPLIPFRFKGIVWYQGESNTQFDYLYKKLLRTMITDWRSGSAQGEFPFIVIQLPNYLQVQTAPVENAPRATIREAQAAVAFSEKNVGLVTTMDIGAEDIHPQNKQDVGQRAALYALGLVYGQKIDYAGPTYTGMTKEGNSIRLHFTNLGGGLMVGKKNGLDPVEEVPGGELKGFAVAGPDGNFVWAKAAISDDSATVAASEVSNPQTVRYAWASNPIGNLYNRAGFPASPFRTDGPTP